MSSLLIKNRWINKISNKKALTKNYKIRIKKTIKLKSIKINKDNHKMIQKQKKIMNKVLTQQKKKNNKKKNNKIMKKKAKNKVIETNYKINNKINKKEIKIYKKLI